MSVHWVIRYGNYVVNFPNNAHVQMNICTFYYISGSFFGAHCAIHYNSYPFSKPSAHCKVVTMVEFQGMRYIIWGFFLTKLFTIIKRMCEPDSSVGIATGYGLDGAGIESRWGRDFPHLSRPVLGSTQPPVNGYRVFPGGKERPGRDEDPSPPSSAVVMKG